MNTRINGEKAKSLRNSKQSDQRDPLYTDKFTNNWKLLGDTLKLRSVESSLNEVSPLSDKGAPGLKEASVFRNSLKPLTSYVIDKVTTLLSMLDKLKDAVHFHSTVSDVAYVLLDKTTSDISTSLSSILNIRYLDIKQCNPLEKKDLFEPFHRTRDGRMKPNKNFVSKTCIFFCLDYSSSHSAIYFIISLLEVYLDFQDINRLNVFNNVLDGFLFLLNLTHKQFVPYAKYITVFPIALYMEQVDMPPVPTDFPEDRNLLFKGKFKKFIKSILNTKSDENVRLFQGILQGVKRATLTVPPSYIESSLMKHVKMLTSESPYQKQVWYAPIATVDEVWGDIDPPVSEFMIFSTDFNNKMNELSRGFQFSLDDLDYKYTPSSNASLETPTHVGGQFAGIQTQFMESMEFYRGSSYSVAQFKPIPIYKTSYIDNEGNNVTINPDDYKPFNKDGSINEFLDREMVVDYEAMEKAELEEENMTSFDFKLSRRPYDSQLDAWDILHHHMKHLNTPLHSIVINEEGETQSVYAHQVPKDLFLRILDSVQEDTERDLTCNVIPLVEPLKVRIITTGEQKHYFLAKPLQKAIWKHMQTFPQFVLTGKPLQESDLFSLLEQEQGLCQKLKFSLGFDQWVSGDYSAATDNLDGFFSKSALAPFIRKGSTTPLLERYLHTAAKTLLNHKLAYRIQSNQKAFKEFLEAHDITYEYDGDKTYTVKQRTGQLMGSPLSFPALCFVNLICYWMALEEYVGRRLHLKELPVRINGDDIAFRANFAFYAIWKRYVARVSFKLSLGKNYIHPNLLTINSILFRFKAASNFSIAYNPPSWGLDYKNELFKVSFVHAQYLNVGLLTGQSKSILRKATRVLPLGDLYKIVMDGAVNKARAHERFVHYNLLNINKMTDNGLYNLFLPVYLGGLGFQHYPEVAVVYTTFQRRFATFLLSKIEESLLDGIYPKKYMSAMIQENRATSISVTTYHRKKKLILYNALSPLPLGFETFSGYDAFELPALSTYRNNYEEPILKYRLPSRSLMKEFNSISKSDSGDYSEIKEMNLPLLSSLPLFPHIVEVFDEYTQYHTHKTVPILFELEEDLSMYDNAD